MDDFNNKGKTIQKQGYKAFLKENFEKYHDKDLPLIKTIQLSSILCTRQHKIILNIMFAGFIQVKYINLNKWNNIDSFRWKSQNHPTQYI